MNKESEKIKGEKVESDKEFCCWYYIEETGLYYNWWRWYKNEVGRYEQRDLYEHKINSYVYGMNNPLLYIDISGAKDCYGEWQRHGWDRVFNIVCKCYWLCVPCDIPIIWSGNK
ncbi:MAG: hypothetical protein N2169_08070, partial [bacterium]|nr:hypothetical protein [bacterium]